MIPMIAARVVVVVPHVHYPRRISKPTGKMMMYHLLSSAPLTAEHATRHG
jgi:hypothetical protein